MTAHSAPDRGDRGDRGDRNGGDKRERILDAAERIFARDGFFAAKVADVAKDAGVADGTIYLYFKTKDEILVTLFREKMAEWVASVRREVAAERDPLAKVRKIVALHFRVLEENPELAEVLQVELRQGQKFFRGASAHEVSAYSLTAVTRRALPLMEGRSGSIVTLTYLSLIHI